MYENTLMVELFVINVTYTYPHNRVSDMQSTFFWHSNPQVHEIAYSNYIGFALLASMYNNQRP